MVKCLLGLRPSAVCLPVNLEPPSAYSITLRVAMATFAPSVAVLARPAAPRRVQRRSVAARAAGDNKSYFDLKGACVASGDYTGPAERGGGGGDAFCWAQPAPRPRCPADHRFRRCPASGAGRRRHSGGGPGAAADPLAPRRPTGSSGLLHSPLSLLCPRAHARRAPTRPQRLRSMSAAPTALGWSARQRPRRPTIQSARRYTQDLPALSQRVLTRSRLLRRPGEHHRVFRHVWRPGDEALR